LFTCLFLFFYLPTITLISPSNKNLIEKFFFKKNDKKNKTLEEAYEKELDDETVVIEKTGTNVYLRIMELLKEVFFFKLFLNFNNFYID